jgi:hypothetical protein
VSTIYNWHMRAKLLEWVIYRNHRIKNQQTEHHLPFSLHKSNTLSLLPQWAITPPHETWPNGYSFVLFLIQFDNAHHMFDVITHSINHMISIIEFLTLLSHRRIKPHSLLLLTLTLRKLGLLVGIYVSLKIILLSQKV